MKKSKKDKLIEAFLYLAAENGFHNVRISDITEQAGVAKGSFYTYFKDKLDCFKTVTYDLIENINKNYIPAISTENNHPLRFYSKLIFKTNWNNKKIGRLYAAEILLIDNELWKTFTTANKNIYKEIIAKYSPNTEEINNIKAFLTMGLIDALIFDIFECDNSMKPIIEQHFITAFENIVLQDFKEI